MNEIICPHCHKAFKVDEAGYADILKQVRDTDFERQLHERLELAEKDKLNAVALAVAEAVRLSIDSLEDICSLVVDGLKQGRPADGLCQAVKKTGELLAPHLPPAVGDANEITNQLILID
ncbi:MAG: hypothetical protein WBM45_10550 [Woeseiaceae bacterium]